MAQGCWGHGGDMDVVVQGKAGSSVSLWRWPWPGGGQGDPIGVPWQWMTSRPCPQFLALALKLGLLYYGGQMVAAGTISTGDLVTFLMYQMQFTSSIEVAPMSSPMCPHPAVSPCRSHCVPSLCPQVLLRYYPSMTKAVGSSEKIFEFLDEEEQRIPEGTLEPEVQGHLKLEDVWFSYPEQQEPVLKVGTGIWWAMGT